VSGPFEKLDGPERAGIVGEEFAFEFLLAEAGVGVERIDGGLEGGGQMRVGAGRAAGEEGGGLVNDPIY
jgi:hypothetical protein